MSKIIQKFNTYTENRPVYQKWFGDQWALLLSDHRVIHVTKEVYDSVKEGDEWE